LKTIITLFLLSAIICFTGCRDEVVNNIPATIAGKGVYVLSEGGFSAGSSKLSFYNINTNSISENIFHPGSIGLFPDGLILKDNMLYLLEQGNFNSAGKIYLLDTGGAVDVSSSIGTNPYSLTIANDKVYITNGPSNNVSVLNLSIWQVTGSIPVGTYPQEIISGGGKVFVCNTSVYQGATDSTVSVIDAATDQVVHTIKVRQTPSSLAFTNDGKLLIGCPGTSATGIIYKYDIDTYSRLDSFVISNGFASGFDRDIRVDPNNDNIYFLCYTNNVVKLNLSTKQSELFITNQNAATEIWTGYNFDAVNGKHYVANAKDFVTSGSLIVFDLNGNMTGTFATGISPRRIVVKN